MTYFRHFTEYATEAAAGRVIDLPRDMWTVLPERRPAPGRLSVVLTLAAVVGVSLLFAVGVI